MQQAIQPGDQMWLDVASLIRTRVPDRKGNVLPADASFGTYDLRDLSPGLGSLTQGERGFEGLAPASNDVIEYVGCPKLAYQARAISHSATPPSPQYTPLSRARLLQISAYLS